MQLLKNTFLKEIQCIRKCSINILLWWAREWGRECARAQFYKNIRICHVCVEIYLSVTSGYFKGVETRFLFSLYFLIFAKVCILSTYYVQMFSFSFFFKILFIYFRQRGREGEREGEKHQCVVASSMPLIGDLAHNPGVCPDWESNWRPFGLQAGPPSTEPHQPGQKCFLM